MKTKATQDEVLLREAYDNFPEAGVCVPCVGWDYDKFLFEFKDEDGKTYRVNLAKAKKGLKLFKAAIARGELPGLGLPTNYLSDTGEWDAFAFDALNQMAIYGEVIYG